MQYNTPVVLQFRHILFVLSSDTQDSLMEAFLNEEDLNNAQCLADDSWKEVTVELMSSSVPDGEVLLRSMNETNKPRRSAMNWMQLPEDPVALPAKEGPDKWLLTWWNKNLW